MNNDYSAVRGCNTKRSLALEYFPEFEHRPQLAVQKLMRWVRSCPDLCRELYATDVAYARRKSLTVRQKMLIIKYLGDP